MVIPQSLLIYVPTCFNFNLPLAVSLRVVGVGSGEWGYTPSAPSKQQQKQLLPAGRALAVQRCVHRVHRQAKRIHQRSLLDCGFL